MSSRAHRPADEGLADFAASERSGAAVREGDATDEATALDTEVISSEREAQASAEQPRIAELPPRIVEASASVAEQSAEQSPQAADRVASDVSGVSDESAQPAPLAPAVSAPGEPADSGAIAAEHAATPVSAMPVKVIGGPLEQADAPAVPDAPEQLIDARSEDAAPPPAPSEPNASADEDDLAGEPESIEVESRDIEPLELALEGDELREPYAGAPDVSEMTADELALETQSEGGEDHAWSAEAAMDSEEPAPGGAGDPAAAGRGSRFDAPWVDEVPDPVTPYEQRISETVRVADLPPAEQLRGRVLANRYIAEEIAEQTPSSISYRAYHLALDRAVNVKILPRGLACPDETCQEVRRLATIATKLAHPNVAAMLDFGVLPDGWPFLVTEQLAGQSLGTLLREEGKFVLRRVLHIGKQIAAGLGAAHDAGLVHGLLNPDNVFVIEPGTSAEVALIVGFGVSSARGAVPGPPRSGVFGVPFYVSPEQAGCRPLDARSDIYSLGVVLYELMTGRPPFTDGDFAGVLCQHLDDEAPAPSSRLRAPGALAKAMDAIILRCLRKEPARRYQTAEELADDLIRLEAAAARTKRRPMPEVKRPTTTIHSPPPKAAEGAVGPEAKVIVHDEVDDQADIEPGTDSGAPETAAPATPSRPSASTPVSGTGAAVRDKAAATVVRPPVTRAPRISVDQATIKISAVDRALIARPGAPIRPAASDGGESEAGGWVQRLGSALKRLFGGGPGNTR